MLVGVSAFFLRAFVSLQFEGKTHCQKGFMWQYFIRLYMWYYMVTWYITYWNAPSGVWFLKTVTATSSPPAPKLGTTIQIWETWLVEQQKTAHFPTGDLGEVEMSFGCVPLALSVWCGKGFVGLGLSLEWSDWQRNHLCPGPIASSWTVLTQSPIWFRCP